MDEVLEDIAAKTPGVEVRLADGLGADIRIAELVRERISALPPSGAQSQPKTAPVGILLVKAGTQTRYDDCLWLKELGSWVERDLGAGYAVEVAQVPLRRPRPWSTPPPRWWTNEERAASSACRTCSSLA